LGAGAVDGQRCILFCPLTERKAIASHSTSFRGRLARRCGKGLDKMLMAPVAGASPGDSGTKLYDLLAAAPLIAWFAFCGAEVLPSLGQRLALVPEDLTA
jgi:hypothetical protein